MNFYEFFLQQGSEKMHKISFVYKLLHPLFYTSMHLVEIISAMDGWNERIVGS